MKKKNLFFAAAAILLASCTDTSYLGDQAANMGTGPISFDMSTPAVTRAGGSTAATALGNQFIVWGEKNEINAGESGANVTTAPGATGRDGHLVFPNYQVNWVANAHSTTSNSDGWEYVGYTHSSAYQSHIQTCANPSEGTPTLVNALTADQTIKYWDNYATSYTFTAISAANHLVSSNTDIENGYITIQKNTTGTTVYDKGYKITATANADLSTLYISDRVNLTAKNSPVTLTFRNVLSQIRVGIYEIIPGYAISSIKFYKTDGTTEYKVEETSAFGAVCPNVKGTGANTFTVTYGDGTTYIENQPIITPSASSSNDLILGMNTSTVSTSSTLGTEATSPTWDTSGGLFTTVFPQINNTTNLTLTCDYTLYNSNTGETINIKGKTAKIPYQYLQWKPNYKYSYLFKITDDNLSPITFDAVEIVAEDGQAEYITTVTEPSITTFGYDETNNKYVASSNDYAVGNDIYVTIMDNGSVVLPTPHNNFHLYSNIVSSDPTNFPITEASVKEAIEVASTGTKKITFDHPCNEANSWFDTHCIAVTSVPAEDGTTKTVNAVKLTGLTAGTYAVQYRKTGGADDIYTAVDATTFTAGTTSVSSYYTLGSFTAATGTYSAAAGITYYEYDTTDHYYKVKEGLSEGADVTSYYTFGGTTYTAVTSGDTYSPGITYYSKTAGGALSAGNNYYKVIIVH